MQKLADELQKEGCKEKMSCYRCDVTKEDDVIKMFEKINAEHGGIDVLINNAGLTRDAPLLSGDVASWNLMLQVSGVRVKAIKAIVTSLRSKRIFITKIRITYNRKKNKNINLPELAELTKKSNAYSATKGNQ